MFKQFPYQSKAFQNYLILSKFTKLIRFKHCFSHFIITFFFSSVFELSTALTGQKKSKSNKHIHTIKTFLIIDENRAIVLK